MKKNWLARLLPAHETQIETFQPPSPEVMERVLLSGDLSTLTAAQRLSYYESVSRSLGLNPLTKPFEYITLNGKLTLYARKDCTEQLRRRYNISLKILTREITDGCVVVTAKAVMPNGREDESVGSVVLPAGAEAKANAMMKAETKAKRRVTLSICGLGMFDESELETFVENGDAQRRVEAATQNRLAEDTNGTEAITEDNFGDTICHIGKAEGNMLGKKVSEIHPNILEWLDSHYGEGDETPRWGNPPSKKDERLKRSVEIALDKLKSDA